MTDQAMTSSISPAPVSAPYIPDNAPFTPAQRAWLNGYLAGLFSSQPGGAAPRPPPRR